MAEHLFRHESAKLVAVLARMFGIERLQLAEDVVQEALVRAMQTWPYYGVPDNPAAWITQTAKHLALDVVRREKSFRDKLPGITDFVERTMDASGEGDSIFFDHEIQDSRLRMMFACCHPLIPQDARVALALKTLCGFGVAEIAKAFLSTEAAVAQRLTRARTRIREAGVPLEIPVGQDVAGRIESVEQTLYLLFNEGYKASTGDNLVREDLCFEALRLIALLVEHPVGDRPRTHALAALMFLSAARLPARVDADGGVLRLRDQDRAKWDRAAIARGLFHLERAATGDDLTSYHLQAGIAACHCVAPDYGATDWARILALYDRLVEVDDSPVAALNRAVALAHVHGPQAGLDALRAMAHRGRLDGYYLLYAVQAEFEADLGRFEVAADLLRRAVALTDLVSEKALLERRLQECQAKTTAPLREAKRPSTGR